MAILLAWSRFARRACERKARYAVQVLLKKRRTTTVLAVRFSQLATVPAGLLEYIKIKYPEVAFRMISLLGNYYTNYHRKITSGRSPSRVEKKRPL